MKWFVSVMARILVVVALVFAIIGVDEILLIGTTLVAILFVIIELARIDNSYSTYD